MYIYIHLLGPFGVLKKWRDGILRSESAQDPEDDDWKQRPRYACPRKVRCFFPRRFQQEGTLQKAWVN